jgi:hypothetical protein
VIVLFSWKNIQSKKNRSLRRIFYSSKFENRVENLTRITPLDISDNNSCHSSFTSFIQNMIDENIIENYSSRIYFFESPMRRTSIVEKKEKKHAFGNTFAFLFQYERNIFLFLLLLVSFLSIFKFLPHEKEEKEKKGEQLNRNNKIKYKNNCRFSANYFNLQLIYKIFFDK